MRKSCSSAAGCAFSGTVSLIAVAGLALSGCATASKNVATTYVSPLQYQAYDCEQLGAEAARIQSRVTALGGRLDEAAQNDAALTGVGLVLFWPALFFLGGTKDQEAEYSRLKGEYDAVQEAGVGKKCSLSPAISPAAAASAASDGAGATTPALGAATPASAPAPSASQPGNAH